MQDHTVDPSRSGRAKDWAQLKPEILGAIGKDAQPAVFTSLLADVRKMMEHLKSSETLSVISVELQDDALVFFSQIKNLSDV